MNDLDIDTRPTILMVNVPARIEQLLRSEWGGSCRFMTASNAVEFFERLGSDPPDAVVTDAVLPSVTAVDLMRSLRSVPATTELPVAVFSRGQDERVTAACTEAGASIVVTPTVCKARLRAWFEAVISRREAAWAPPALNSDMATSIAAATRDVIEALLGVEAECGALRIEKTLPRRADVIGAIDITGFVRGGITTFLSLSCAEMIAGCMLGCGSSTPTDEEIVDAVGVLTNMIAGDIKTRLCRTEELFSMSPPSVVIGREVRRVRIVDNLAFLLPCSLQGEELLVEFHLMSRRRAEAAVPTPQHVRGV